VKSSNDVADALRPLSERGFFLLQDIELVKGKIDNVVVGPSGVYLLYVRRWRGRVRLSRRNKIMCGSFTREGAKRSALDQATLVRRQLAAWGVVRSVKTVIVVTSAEMDHGPIDLREVSVVPLDLLAGWIGGRTYRLAPLEIEQIRESLTPQTGQAWKTKRQ
jgi:hypothetical protein